MLAGDQGSCTTNGAYAALMAVAVYMPPSAHIPAPPRRMRSPCEHHPRRGTGMHPDKESELHTQPAAWGHDAKKRALRQQQWLLAPSLGCAAAAALPARKPRPRPLQASTAAASALGAAFFFFLLTCVMCRVCGTWGARGGRGGGQWRDASAARLHDSCMRLEEGGRWALMQGGRLGEP